MTFPQLLARILIHEILPRTKKNGRYPPADFVTALVTLEIEGQNGRRETRLLLDRYFELTA